MSLNPKQLLEAIEKPASTSRGGKWHVDCHVLIYQNKDDDRVSKRHVALWFTFEGALHFNHQKLRIRVIRAGDTGPWQHSADYGYDKSKSKNIDGDAKVGRLTQKMAAVDVEEELKKVEVPKTGGDNEENCHDWIKAALSHMKDKGWITDYEMGNGVENMELYLQYAQKDGHYKDEEKP